ncbi:50S ribosomal protein L25/general stress protein Ctc [Kribbella solani]|uniref:50S ribosomal protein L25/general stress protein Ctc n=1 Tax=Kribbella solani TaxID=236067 RepID=UPI0029AD6EA3|nr:50S ribosomal protein L25/general stress protein Ctc [Kribbella solani]MDX2971400.1 50S ribosomal protein L25/general stress protein Ctc [Kribbella solani]MDX3004155.1 50S ribosomal protein L25/general stress protein Ctc [Kribbella solani]
MAEVKIQAESRTEFGKGAARRIRRDNKVPAVLYGHGSDPVHITLPGHDTMLALKTANALLFIEVEGGESHLALPKQVQRDPLKGYIEHVDLVIVKRGEKVQVEVAVHLEGEAVSDALVVTEHPSILVEAEATHIPESITVSVEGLEIGAQIHASDLKLPTGATLAIEPDTLVVNVTAQPTAEQVDAEMAEAGVEKDEPVAAAAE